MRRKTVSTWEAGEVVRKTCSKCSQDKPSSSYSKDRRLRSGLQSQCRECHEQSRDKTAVRNRHLKRKYGISSRTYDQMFLAQAGLCLICESPPRTEGWRGKLAVDHCHATGKIRGLLCNQCNQAIGKLNDDPGLVEQALRYLKGELTCVIG